MRADALDFHGSRRGRRYVRCAVDMNRKLYHYVKYVFKTGANRRAAFRLRSDPERLTSCRDPG